MQIGEHDRSSAANSMQDAVCAVVCRSALEHNSWPADGIADGILSEDGLLGLVWLQPLQISLELIGRDGNSRALIHRLRHCTSCKTVKQHCPCNLYLPLTSEINNYIVLVAYVFALPALMAEQNIQCG